MRSAIFGYANDFSALERWAFAEIDNWKRSMASPKPTMAALAALPGIVAKATAEANADAEREAAAFLAVMERKDKAFDRVRHHRARMGASIGEMEKFADDIDAALGGNGAPADLPTTEGSPAPSDPPQTGPAGDTRANAYSELHPSQRSPVAVKVPT